MTEEEKQLDRDQGIHNLDQNNENPGLTELIDTVEVTNEEPSLDEKGETEASESPAMSTENDIDVSAETASADAERTFHEPMADQSQAVNDLKAQLEERTSQYLRIAADFENFRKRTQKEKEDLEVQVKCSTISELLPVVDNFERARLQIKPQTEAEANIHKSYQSVYKQLVECLKRVGVSPMRSEGKEFDPSLHEAVMREATDQHEEGTVIEELVRGYHLGDRVLRHALVKVAAPPDSPSNEEVEVS